MCCNLGTQLALASNTSHKYKHTHRAHPSKLGNNLLNGIIGLIAQHFSYSGKEARRIQCFGQMIKQHHLVALQAPLPLMSVRVCKTARAYIITFVISPSPVNVPEL